MASPRYRTERLGRNHDRTAFSCGEESLDTYFRQRARQDDDRNVAKVFVLVDTRDNRVAGYYTLSASAIQLEDLPAEMQRGLPRYPLVPVVLLGRLAIDEHYHGQGLGGALLFNALRRAFETGTQQIAATAVIVDALHGRARSFYERYGFESFPDNSLRLLLMMKTIAQLLSDADS